MIDTHRADLNFQLGNLQFFNQFILKRLPRLGAQAADTFVSIVA